MTSEGPFQSKLFYDSTILPLHSAFMGPHVEHWVKLWSPQYKKDLNPWEQAQRRVTKINTGLEHLSCEGKLKERVGVVQPGDEKGDLIVAFQ